MNTMNSMTSKLAKSLATMGAMVALSAHAVNDLPGGPAVRQLNLPVGVTKIAEEQSNLHWMMLIICTVIFIAVFSVMFYSILKHRKSVGHAAKPLAEPIWVEITWTLIPFLIVIGLALPATKAVVAQKDTSNPDLTIKATGIQWKWGYEYLKGEGEGINFLSTLDNAHRILSNEGAKGSVPDDYLLKVDNPLVVPVNKKVRIITTASDVIHAFAVPQFGIKQDAIPGFVRDTWFRAEKTGDFYGQCQELCGKEHAYMPIHVKVVSQEQYSAWVSGEQKKMAAKLDDPNKVWAMSDILARGEKVYNANCSACHQPNGKGAGPIKPLDGSAIVQGPKADQMRVLLEGRNNGAMPSWKQLSDTDLAAVTTFTKNHWGNKTSQLVQPAEYAAARTGKFPEGGGAVSAAVPVAAAAPAANTAAPAANTAQLPLSVYFDSGTSALDAKAKATIADAAAYLTSHADVKVALSGFVDSTGLADQNAKLAKDRAAGVRNALQAAGVAADRVEMRKPETIAAGAGNDGAARRVEIKAL